MAYQITATEYLTLDTVPLMTPAWFCDDFSELLNGPGARGNDITAGSRPGQLARRRTLDARQAALSFVIYGHKDAEGNAHADLRTGLFENIDEFKRLLTPNMNVAEGTRSLYLITDEFTRETLVHVSPDIQLVPLGPGAVRATVLVTIPSGVFRDIESTTVTFNSAGNHTLMQSGTGYVIDTAVVVQAVADSFYITAGSALLRFQAPINGTVSMYGGTFFAYNQSSTDVTGFVVTENTPFWLPLNAGQNDVSIYFENLVGSPIVEITSYGVWL